MSEFHTVNLPSSLSVHQVAELVDKCAIKAKGLGQMMYMTPAVLAHSLVADIASGNKRINLYKTEPGATLDQVFYAPQDVSIYCAPSMRMSPLVLGRFTEGIDDEEALKDCRCSLPSGMSIFSGLKPQVIQELFPPLQDKEAIEGASKFVYSLLSGSGTVWVQVEAKPLSVDQRIRAAGEVLNIFLAQVKRAVGSKIVPDTELERQGKIFGRMIYDDRKLLSLIGSL